MSFLKNKSFLEKVREIKIPFTEGIVHSLDAGDMVLLTGTLYTGRDHTHRLMLDLLDKGERLPVEFAGEMLYYVGPSPARPGKVIGAAGPTTSYRMDSYTPRLLELGLKATMGKGQRSEMLRQKMQNCGAVYFAAFGGAGAYLSRCIKKSELVAFPEAGPEALYRFRVERFPALVINDVQGRDYYSMVKYGETTASC
ncbi:MAG: FumA C-terminus/TtdB family hydratase beta subunit [Thermodesulfobacteriota bacterium]